MPQFKLKGGPLSYDTGIMHESVDIAEASDPSQKLSSGLKVVLSLWRT